MAEAAWSDRVSTPAMEEASQPTEDGKPWTAHGQPLPMFYVHYENGYAWGFQYFNMLSPEFLGERVKVSFHEATITITGRHLWDLFRKLLEHKIHAIRERHEHEGLVSSP
jgi:hypothetical protein